ncbi:hypothetical protein BZG02_08620 [Labilibaculum filiforme]|uniref:Uncharacterized protein n=1 Tax=Labilibaculum filiforme TaxID=1940526 RepID=A0A2N3HZL1_9BACT|nr:hypothetical protein BZG02_08620 [Labilibaculum filiforme]
MKQFYPSSFNCFYTTKVIELIRKPNKAAASLSHKHIKHLLTIMLSMPNLHASHPFLQEFKHFYYLLCRTYLYNSNPLYLHESSSISYFYFRLTATISIRKRTKKSAENTNRDVFLADFTSFSF